MMDFFKERHIYDKLVDDNVLVWESHEDDVDYFVKWTRVSDNEHRIREHVPVNRCNTFGQSRLSLNFLKKGKYQIDITAYSEKGLQSDKSSILLSI